MKLFDVVTTASSNMFRSKVRTFLTVTAIFIGAFTLTLTTGLGSGISHYIDQQMDSLGAKDVLIIQPVSDGDNGLPGEPEKYDSAKHTASIEAQGNRKIAVLAQSDLDKIRQTEGVKSAEAYQVASLDYASGKSGDKYSATADIFITGQNFPLDAGRYPAESTVPEVLLPSTYLKALGYADAASALGQPVKLAVTDSLGKQTEVGGTITGVEQKTLVGGNSLYLNRAFMNQLRQRQNVGAPAASTSTFFAALAHFDSSMSEAKQKDLKDRLKKAGYDAKTVEDQVSSLKSVINGIIAVLNGFAAIALLAASFGIINTLLMSVQERTKEIGLMKAMGMGAGKIFLLFSFEAMMLGFWGSLIGSFAAIGIGTAVSRFVQQGFLKDLVGLQLLAFSPASVATIIGIVMAIAFLAGTLPAIRAARQNPIDSLRYE